MKLFWWLTLLVCGLAVSPRTSKKRRLAESSDEEPLDVPTSRNSAGERLLSDEESIELPPDPWAASDEFTLDLKRRWARGTLSSVDVHQLAKKS